MEKQSSKIIVANWKMNKTLKDSLEFLEEFLNDDFNIRNEIIICPSFTSLYAVSKKLLETPIKLGAQNCFYKRSGAFTGEISPAMLLEIGVSYVIIGHSERRLYFRETSEMINKKIIHALKNGLKVILCIGETKDERDRGIVAKIITKELESCLIEINKDEIKNLVIAYEPIWAIGSGEAINSNEAADICKFIRQFISKTYSEDIAKAVKILYGGSLNLENFKDFLNKEHIDGALIGNASLDALSFKKIVEFNSVT